jgi:hypothetical protein
MWWDSPQQGPAERSAGPFLFYLFFPHRQTKRRSWVSQHRQTKKPNQVGGRGWRSTDRTRGQPWPVVTLGTSAAL